MAFMGYGSKITQKQIDRIIEIWRKGDGEVTATMLAQRFGKKPEAIWAVLRQMRGERKKIRGVRERNMTQFI